MSDNLEDVTALAWTEKMSYIECPICGHIEEFTSDGTWTCSSCNKTFKIDDQTE